MIGQKIQKDVTLAPFTTFKIGGPAKYFLTVENTDGLVEALEWAKNKKIPYFILGGGSNILVSDKGFNGLIIKLGMNDYSVSGTNIEAGAGVLFYTLVVFSIEHSLAGLEWAAGIPGTIGGAVRGNAGAFGHSISENVKKVKVLKDKSIIELKNKDIHFSYRHSILKQNKDVILKVTLGLEKGIKNKSEDMIKKYILHRSKIQPPQFSCGSVFKNQKFSSIPQALFKKFPEIKKFKPKGMVPTGWLIEQCGIKGTEHGEASISEKHANFIVNNGSAKAKNILSLINLAKSKVKNKFGIELEEEIIYIGF